jgi:hypothetical protein
LALPACLPTAAAACTGAKVDKLRALIDDHLKPQGGGDAQN